MSVAVFLAAMRLWMPHGCNKLCVGWLEDLVPFVLLMIYWNERNKAQAWQVGRTQNVATGSRGALTACGLGH